VRLREPSYFCCGVPGAPGPVGVGTSCAQPTASIANAATSAAATVRTASVLLLLFVLIGGLFHGLSKVSCISVGSATDSLADAIGVIATAGSFHRPGTGNVVVREDKRTCTGDARRLMSAPVRLLERAVVASTRSGV